jgi:hypothetical protein
MGDAVTVSRKNKEETEGTVCCAADGNAHQNHDVVKALQEFKELKSVSAAGLKSNSEQRAR